VALAADVVAQEVDVLPQPAAQEPLGAVADGEGEQHAAQRRAGHTDDDGLNGADVLAEREQRDDGRRRDQRRDRVQRHADPEQGEQRKHRDAPYRGKDRRVACVTLRDSKFLNES
jgi:hypothetical protein